MNPIPCPDCGAPVVMVQTVHYRWALEPEDIGREVQAVTARQEVEPEVAGVSIVCSKDSTHLVGPVLVKDAATGALCVDGLPVAASVAG